MQCTSLVVHNTQPVASTSRLSFAMTLTKMTFLIQSMPNGKRARTFGLPPDEVGFYMEITDWKGGSKLVRLNSGRS